MSKRPTGLLTVRMLAEKKERQAAKRFADSLRRLEDKISKISELESYLKEYCDSIATLGGQGISIGEMRRRRDFISQLNVVISQQHGPMDAAHQLVEENRLRWLQEKKKLEALSDLIAQKNQQLQRQEERNEQKISDDQAGRQHRSNQK